MRRSRDPISVVPPRLVYNRRTWERRASRSVGSAAAPVCWRGWCSVVAAAVSLARAAQRRARAPKQVPASVAPAVPARARTRVAVALAEVQALEAEDVRAVPLALLLRLRGAAAW